MSVLKRDTHIQRRDREREAGDGLECALLFFFLCTMQIDQDKVNMIIYKGSCFSYQ